MIMPMFPLQVDLTDFWKKNTSSSTDIIVFIIVLAVVVAAIIVVNALGKKTPTAAGSGKAGSGKAASGRTAPISVNFFSGFTLHRMARSIGLNRDQIKMLDFAFKTDQVVDPEKSFNTPALLDRHFKRAYRAIEQSSSPDVEVQNRLSVLFSTRNMLESNVGGSLTSTAQLKEDTTVVINIGRDKYNVPVVSAKGEHLAVESPKNALGSPIKLERGNRFTALIFTKNNKSFSFETRVIGYSATFGTNTLLLSHSNQLKFLSQRRYRRKQAVIPCNLFLVVVEGSKKKQRLIVDKRRLMGNIADISVGGCSIKIKAPVQVGAKLKIEFNQGDIKIAALGQVLRTNRAGMVTVIHIKFLKLSRKSMNVINAFVYEYAYV